MESKNDIELFEYFRKKGWILNPRKMQLIVAAYGLGYHDALLGADK